MRGSGHRHQHQRPQQQQQQQQQRVSNGRDGSRDIRGADLTGVGYDQDWDDDVYYAPASRSREGNGHALRANGSMPTSERQSGSGSVGESGVGGDRALASAAKDGGRDRTPTKGHYMKVPNMRHMRALRPSNLMAIEALADILQSNTNTNTDQQQSYPPPTSSLESEIAHISEATASSSSCSGDGSSGSSSLLPLAAAATPSSIESLSLQHMAKNAGVREASAAEAQAPSSPPSSPLQSAPTLRSNDEGSPPGIDSTNTVNHSLVCLRSTPRPGGAALPRKHIAGSPAGGSLLKYKGDGFPKLGGRANKKICAGPMTPAAIAESHTEATAFMAPAAQRAEVDSQGSSQGGSEEGNREHAWGSNVNGGGSGGNRFGVEGARSSASRKRRSSGGPGQRVGPATWPKLPGEGSTPPKQPPNRPHLVSEPEQGGELLSGEWSEEGGGAGNSTSGGRTSQEDWLEGGRQKRERVVASSTRVCSVEHDHRHKDGLEPQHDHHRHHQYEHEEKRPTSSGSSSSSHCTPKGTAGNSTPTSNVSYSSSDGATARSKPSAAPSLRVGVASRKRGSDGERQQYGDGSRQKGMPCDSSRGPSVTERPARWAAKGASSRLQSPAQQRPSSSSSSSSSSKSRASSSRIGSGSKSSVSPMGGVGPGFGGRAVPGFRRFGSKSRSKGGEDDRHMGSQVRTFKVSSVFQATAANSSSRPRGAVPRPGWPRSPHTSCAGGSAHSDSSRAAQNRTFDPTRILGSPMPPGGIVGGVAAESEEVEEVASDDDEDVGRFGGIDREGPQNDVTNCLTDTASGQSDWSSAGNDHFNRKHQQRHTQRHRVEVEHRGQQIGSDARLVVQDREVGSSQEGSGQHGHIRNPLCSSQGMGRLPERDERSPTGTALDEDYPRGERGRVESGEGTPESRVARDKQDSTVVQHNQQQLDLNKQQRHRVLKRGEDGNQVSPASDLMVDQTKPAAMSAPPPQDIISPGGQDQDQQYQAHCRPPSPPPRTPVRPRTLASSMFSRGPPYTASSTPATSGGNRKGKGNWRPSFGSGDGGGMPAPWGAAGAFSTPSRVGANVGEAVPSAGFGLGLGATGSATARRRKGGGVGNGPIGRLLQKVRGIFDGGEAKLLSGEFRFRQQIVSAASYDASIEGGRGEQGLPTGGRSRRDHGDPRTRCSAALDVTVLPCSSRKRDYDLAMVRWGAGQDGGGGPELVRFSCFVHRVLDVRGEGGGHRGEGNFGIISGRLRVLEGSCAHVVFKTDTIRALDIGPGSQLRIYDPCCVQREGLEGGVGPATVGALLACTQLCEPYPVCLPPLPLPAVEASDAGR